MKMTLFPIKSKKIATLCGLAIFSFSLLGLHGAPMDQPKTSSPAPVAKTTKPTQAILFVNSDLERETTTLEIRFDEPIVSAEWIKQKAELPLKLTPALPYELTWRDTQSVTVHLPSIENPDTEIHFVLEAGLKTRHGHELPEIALGTWKTPSLSKISGAPRWFDRKKMRQAEILLCFNYSLSPEQGGEAFVYQTEKKDKTIRAQARPATLEDYKRLVGTFQENWLSEASFLKIDQEKVQDDSLIPNALVFVPETPLTEGVRWELRSDNPIPWGDSNSHVRANIQHSIGSIAPFQVMKIKAENLYDTPNRVVIHLNKPRSQDLSSEDLLKHITVTPSVGPLTLLTSDPYDWEYKIQGDFQLDTPYVVRVEAGIAADDETVLAEAKEVELTFKPNSGYVGIPFLGEHQFAHGTRKLKLAWANVSSATLRIKEISPEDFPAALHLMQQHESKTYRSLYESQYSEKLEKFSGIPFEEWPGTLVHEHTIQNEAKIDDSDSIEFDWNSLMQDRKGATFVVEVSGLTLPEIGNEKIVSLAMIPITDLGIITKEGSSGKHAIAFSLQTGQPIPDAEITLHDRHGKKLVSTRSNAAGIAHFPRDPAEVEAVYLVAQHGEQVMGHALHSEEFEIPRWDLNVPFSYRSSKTAPRRTHIFTDRPIYKPSETVYLKSYTRLENGRTLKADPTSADLIIRDAKHRIISKQKIQFSPDGSFDHAIQLPEGNLGVYQIEMIFPTPEGLGEDDMDHGDLRVYHSFLVQDYRPNVFEINLSQGSLSQDRSALNFDLNAQYYMGKALSNSSVIWAAEANPATFQPEGWENYDFSLYIPYWLRNSEDDSEDHASQISLSGETKLSQDGKTQITIPVSAPPESENRFAGPLDIVLSTEITDINQQTISSSKTFRLDSTEFYLGLQHPGWVHSVGKPIDLSFVALLPDGSSGPLTEVQVKIEREVWSTVILKSASNAVRHEHRAEIVPVTEGVSKLNNVDGNAIGTYQFTPELSGHFLVTLSARDQNHRLVQTRTHFWVYGKDLPDLRYDEGNVIALRSDKTTYQPGETAKILIQTPLDGQAWATVERSGVERIQNIQVSKENPILEIPITEDDAPNIFVSVIQVRGSQDDPKKFPAPEYRIGYLELKISAEPHRFEVKVETQSEFYQPGEEVIVKVQANSLSGQPLTNAEVTLFAVDEGVLSLTGFDNPDPARTLYPTNELGVNTLVSLRRLLEDDPSRQPLLNKGLIVGGGDLRAAGLSLEGLSSLRKDFKACAYWAPALATDKNGALEARFKAPDNLTRFRVIAVVASKNHQDFGTSSSEFSVRKPLMLEPVIPNFANLGDQVTLKALVHNETGQDAEFLVSLKINETLSLRPETTDSIQRTLFLKSNQSGTVPFTVEAVRLGQAALDWKVEPKVALDENLQVSDRVESKFEVTYPIPSLSEMRTYKVSHQKGLNLLKDISPEILGGMGKLKITASYSRFLEGGGALDALLSYPYGCVEQTTSSTLPWTFLRDFKPYFPEIESRTDAEFAKAIQAGVNRLLNMQTSQGGLSYWIGESQPVFWGSAYGALGLYHAQKAGGVIPQERLDSLHAYLTQKILNKDASQGVDSNVAAQFDPEEPAKALALYALSLSGKPLHSVHSALYQKRKSLSPVVRVYLALAMHEAGAPAKELLPLLMPYSKNEESWMGSTSMDSLLAFAWQKISPKSPLAERAFEKMISNLTRNGHWGTTWINSWSLMALAEENKNSQKAFQQQISTLTLQWDTEEIELHFDLTKLTLTYEIPFDGNSQNAPNQLIAQTSSNAPCRIQVLATAYPAFASHEPRDHGIKIDRVWKKVEINGDKTLITNPEESLKVGDLIEITLNVETARSYSYLMIEDRLPSLVEPVHMDFKTQQTQRVDQDKVNRMHVSHQELWKDRATFFTHYLNKGKFETTYYVRVINEGQATIPASKAELMYEPQVFGLSPITTFKTSVAK